jgi:hypothetical protein
MFTKTDIEQYFNAEKQESLLLVIIGMAAILLAFAFYFWGKSPLLKGAAIPLILIGLVQGIVGYTVFARSDADRIRNVYAYDMNPGQLRTDELPRMKTVNRNFVIYRWVEIFFALAGGGIYLYFRGRPGQGFLTGLGLALAIQAIFLLGADYFAEKRALRYTRGIQSFLKTD